MSTQPARVIPLRPLARNELPLCERAHCEQRAFPPLQHGLTVDENVRGRSFYSPVDLTDRGEAGGRGGRRSTT